MRSLTCIFLILGLVAFSATAQAEMVVLTVTGSWTAGDYDVSSTGPDPGFFFGIPEEDDDLVFGTAPSDGSTTFTLLVNTASAVSFPAGYNGITHDWYGYSDVTLVGTHTFGSASWTTAGIVTGLVGVDGLTKALWTDTDIASGDPTRISFRMFGDWEGHSADLFIGTRSATTINTNFLMWEYFGGEEIRSETYTATARPYCETPLLEANFNAKALDAAIGTGGAAFGEPVSVSANVAATVRGAPFPTRCLEIVDNNGDPPAGFAGTARFEFSGSAEITTGIITINADLWFDELDYYILYVREQGTSAESFLSLSFLGSGNVVANDDNSDLGIIGSYGTGGIYPVSLVFDMDAGTYDVYLDGCPVVLDEPHGVVGRGVGAVLFGTGHDTDLTGRFFVDNIIVCEAEIPVWPDTTPPELVCPDDIVVECSAAGGVPAGELTDFFNGFIVYDACDPDPDFGNDAPALFEGPCGTSGGVTVVTWTATDASGNTAECSATVTVVDTTPPGFSTLTLDPDVLWPPNHKMADITATVVAADICDPNPTFVLTSITSDEPDNEKGVGDGNTVNDIQGADLGTPDVEFQLRSERQGGGDGRKYSITYTATDCSGNAADSTVCVIVPHDQGGGALAVAGFNVDGTGFEEGASEFTIVIPQRRVGTIDISQTLVGNLEGTYAPSGHFWTPLGDDQSGLVLRFDVQPALNLAQGFKPVIDGDAMAKPDKHQAPQPVGLRYVTTSGEGYLVESILGLRKAELDAGEDERDKVLSTALPEPGLSASPEGIRITLAQSALVRVDVFSVQGRKVRTLVHGNMAAGTHPLLWNGVDDSGRVVPSGVYFYRLNMPGMTQVQRVVRVQ